MSETVAIAGSGTIATGLAVTAAKTGDVILWARSAESAERAQTVINKVAGKADVDPSRVTVTTEIADLAKGTVIVEAISEDPEIKKPLLKQLAELAPEAIICSTTSSLSIEDLGQASGAADRFVGLHVFNPVNVMKLIELIFSSGVSDSIKDRVREMCAGWEKTVVELPDTPGFVVNRLLFPFLFDAIELQERTGVSAEDIDTAMKLGAGHPMGPFALLDFVGLDVSKAIGEVIGSTIPASLEKLVAEGKLGRKTGEGFLNWKR